MWAILLWILTSFLSSTWDSYRKVAIEESRLSNAMFSLLASLLWAIIVFVVFLLFWFSYEILQDPLYLFIVILIICVSFANNFLGMYIFKREKLSVLLPYDSLDKIFIVIIGFIIFYWSDQWTSIITLLITLFTICVIIFSSIDIRKISFPKTILLYFVYKLIKAWTILATGYFLLKYWSIDYVILDWVIYTVLAFWVTLILKESPKLMFEQTKKFYKNRILSTILWWTGYILWLYIIQDSGVIIATLLWFFYIAFSVFSMKFIAKDNPSKKQIILAFVVITLVWIWYYFK